MIKNTITIILLALPVTLFGGIQMSSSSTSTVCINGVCTSHSSNGGSTSSSISMNCVNGVCSTTVKGGKSERNERILQEIAELEAEIAEKEAEYELMDENRTVGRGLALMSIDLCNRQIERLMQQLED